MSKVGNLRAMFENKGETSPPERGRSPGLSASGTESPRPLSKIRTSFVAIEKDGRIGLQRDPSADSVFSSSRKASGGDAEGEASAPAPQESAPSFTDRIQRNARQAHQMETIPQSPPQDTSTFQSLTPAGQTAGSTTYKTGAPEGKNADKAQVAENKDASNVRAEGPAAASKAPKQDVIGNPKGKDAVEKDKPKAAAIDTHALKAGSSKSAPKVSAISTAKLAVKAPAKSPTKPKTPTSPAKAPKLPGKTPEKRGLHPDKSATPKAVPKAAATTTVASTAATPAAATAAKTSASATKKPPVLQASPSGSLDRGVGFVKPKPKSPTRPVALPPSLTTHTAASATKANTQRQSASRQSGSYLSVHPPQGRSPSRASVATVGGGDGGGGTLRRQSSTISRPRPSLGPPPKLPSADHPVTRREREVDEGFLARMMRPTQASSSKTQEKVATTPPRKTPGTTPAAAKRPAAKEVPGGAAKKAPTKTESGATKKAAPKAADATATSKSADKVADKNPSPVAQATENPEAKPKPASGAKAKEPEPKKSASENMKPAPAEKQPVERPAEGGLDKPVDIPPEETGGDDGVANETAVDAVSDGHTAAPAAEPVETEEVQPVVEPVSEPVDVSIAPAEVPAPVDGSLEETASEAEPVEPHTPVEAAAGVDTKAGALLDGAEDSKLVDQDKVLEMQKREDDGTVAE